MEYYSNEKPSSPYCVTLYFWWGSRGNLKLITLGRKTVKGQSAIGLFVEPNHPDLLETIEYSRPDIVSHGYLPLIRNFSFAMKLMGCW